MWSELVGRGFYEPVDDMGPDRSCSAPQTLAYLADHFAGSHYDVKWLLRTIVATEAYQRESRSRYDEQQAPFASNCSQRLRGDQLFNTLAEVFEIDESAVPQRKDKPKNPLASPRGQMNFTFGYDPSERRDEIAGSIPQALFLMNGPAAGRHERRSASRRRAVSAQPGPRSHAQGNHDLPGARPRRRQSRGSV